jgi:hypothetical protein
MTMPSCSECQRADRVGLKKGLPLDIFPLAQLKPCYSPNQRNVIPLAKCAEPLRCQEVTRTDSVGLTVIPSLHR